MKKIFFALLVALLAIGGVKILKKKKEEIESLPTPTPPLVVIKVVKPIQKEINQTKQLLGRYYSLTQAQTGTKIAGFIESVEVKEGEKVKKGEILLKIDSSEIKAQILAQQAKISSLKSQISAQKALLRSVKKDEENTLRSLERDKALYRAKALAREILENKVALYEMKVAKTKSTLATLRTKENELKSSIESLKAKKKLLEYTLLKAPFDGVVEKIFFKEGSFAPIGKPLILLLGNEWVVDLPFSSGIKEGMKALVEGKKCEVKKILPNSINSLKVARLNCPKLPLPNNSQPKVTVIQKSVRGLAYPLKAVYEERGKKYLFLYQNGKFKPVEVEILAQDEKFFIPNKKLLAPVAIGSNEKLAKLFVTQNVEVISE
ncbi:MAG: biotin/lipoyl-binding protein [Epsilonproteobacteria bacterium]|nr:biotin/lipoyl-binding protein [Campylobacterota bacterium]